MASRLIILSVGLCSKKAADSLCDAYWYWLERVALCIIGGRLLCLVYDRVVADKKEMIKRFAED